MKRDFNLTEQQETKKSKGIKNFVIFVGAATILGSATVGGIAIYDANFDHTDGMCQVSHMLGIEHQIKKVKEQSNYEVLTNETRAYNKCDVVCSTIMEPYYLYTGYEKVNGMDAVEFNYELDYKPKVIRENKYTPVTITASEDEILMVDPNKAEVVKVLKIK